MSNPPPVKRPLSNTATAVTTNPTEPPAAPEPNPRRDTLVRLLRPVTETKLHPEAETRLPQATAITISLANHRLRVLHHEITVLETPLATGRPLSPTPEGTFTLAAKPATPPPLRYGHYRNKAGALLVRGVFPKIDPLPADAVFDPVTPKAILPLSDQGPLIIGGEATGAATSDGTLVLPDKIAVLLQETLPVGLPVTIGP